MARRRLYLTGKERAEFEHVFGPLVVDQSDPRFVLVDEETEEKIKAHPHGIPARPHGQDPEQTARVGAVLQEAAKERGAEDVPEPDQKVTDDDPARAIEVDASRGEEDGDQSGKGKKNTRVAASGTKRGGGDVS